MHRNHLIILSFLFFAAPLMAFEMPDPHPIAVNVDTVTDENFPAAYFVTFNYYTFTSAKKIDTVYPADSLFRTWRKGKDVYILDWNEGRRSLPKFGDVDRIPLRIRFHDGSERQFSVKYIFYTPVSILFYDSTGRRLISDQGRIRYGGSIYAKAVWNTPSYTDHEARLRGHFAVHFRSGGVLLSSISGWSDGGDRSRPLDLSQFRDRASGSLTAEINIREISTIYTEAFNLPQKPLQLAADTPAQIEFLLSER
jgi:hypothetical protein